MTFDDDDRHQREFRRQQIQADQRRAADVLAESHREHHKLKTIIATNRSAAQPDNLALKTLASLHQQYQNLAIARSFLSSLIQFNRIAADAEAELLESPIAALTPYNQLYQMAQTLIQDQDILIMPNTVDYLNQTMNQIYTGIRDEISA
jgi:uncharacterized membrane protein YgaE (UPF0421/DUF939 family)